MYIAVVVVADVVVDCGVVNTKNDHKESSLVTRAPDNEIKNEPLHSCVSECACICVCLYIHIRKYLNFNSERNIFLFHGILEENEREKDDENERRAEQKKIS